MQHQYRRKPENVWRCARSNRSIIETLPKGDKFDLQLHAPGHCGTVWSVVFSTDQPVEVFVSKPIINQEKRVKSDLEYWHDIIPAFFYSHMDKLDGYWQTIARYAFRRFLSDWLATLFLINIHARRLGSWARWKFVTSAHSWIPVI